MEKQMTLTAGGETIKKCALIIRKTRALLALPNELLRKYYSYVLEEEVGPERAKAMTEAQQAFFATVMPVDYHIIIRFIACAWFVIALRKLRVKN